jgi:radical SAM superfamily enzyme YgiQ (UPF0313 family)
MNIILSTLNAKFIHASLAVRYLHAYTADIATSSRIQEYNINQHADDIAADLYAAEPDVIGFACYIWNIGATLQVINILKKVKPTLQIVLGGPEVSFDPAAVLTKNPCVDYIIAGEGEGAFRELIQTLQGNGDLKKVKGLAYRDAGVVTITEQRGLLENLDDIPWPYRDLELLQDKIIYYECTRGCPFNCQYCLSSTIQGVRYFSGERVKRDLNRLIAAGVKQVKFVDRTFNCHRQYALEIFRYLASQDGQTNFHFEIAADLLDDETLGFLVTVPPGKFQFEIGVQSTHGPTLALIQRKTDWDRVRHAVEILTQAGNIHLHLDLIAGLPGESYQQFQQSFNDVFMLHPGRLQLGFLKMLKGSGVRQRAQDFDYVFMDEPPYEVLGNRHISYRELLRLKRIEDLLEKYANSHKFDTALQYVLVHQETNPFIFFEAFAEYWLGRAYHKIAHRQKELYRILAEYYCCQGWVNADVFLELLKFDYLREERALQLPDFFQKCDVDNYQQRFYDFLNDPNHVATFLPDYTGLTAREISKRVQIEVFGYDVVALAADPKVPLNYQPTTILFQYEQRDMIYNRAKFSRIEI